MSMNARFSRSQLLALSTLILLSPALRLYPLTSTRLAGRGAWLSALVALPFMLADLLLLCRLLSARREGEGLPEVSLNALGERAGRVFLALLAGWLLLYCGFVLRSGADRFVIGTFPDATPSPFSVSLGLACLIAALGRPRALMRSARILLPVLTGFLAFLLLLSLRGMDVHELLPLTGQDVLPVLAGSLPVIDVLALSLYLPTLLLGGQSPERGAFRRWARWLLGAALLLCALGAAVLGSFGPELTLRLAMPFFTLVRNLSFLRSFERMDALVVSLWLFPDFLLGSCLLWCAQHCLRLCLRLPEEPEQGPRLSMSRGRWLLWLCAAAAIALSLLLWPDGKRLALWSERVIPLCNLCVAFLLIPMIYIVGRARKKLP